jgi:glycosyltransferase involved in cell wall biosynthesis
LEVINESNTVALQISRNQESIGYWKGMMSDNQKKIVFVGGRPAHYIRAFHGRLKVDYASKLRFEFLYVGADEPQRAYETGGYTEGSHFFGFGMLGAWALIRVMHKFQPDIVVAMGHTPLPVMVALMWGLLTNRKVLYFSDTNIYDFFRKSILNRFIKKVLLAPILKRVDILLCPGQRTRDYYSAICGVEHVASYSVWMPFPILPVESDKPFPKSTDNQEFFQVTYLGRLSKEKAVDKLIRAIALIDDDLKSKVRLHIAGDGPELEDLVKLARNLGVEHQIDFLGSIRSDRVGEVLYSANLFALPSSYEPWGIVVAEAMAAGLPVIAPVWVGAVADLVVDGVTGCVLSNNSPKEIAQAISYLARNPELTCKLGRAARERIEAGGWNIDGTVSQFMGALKRIGTNP